MLSASGMAVEFDITVQEAKAMVALSLIVIFSSSGKSETKRVNTARIGSMAVQHTIAAMRKEKKDHLTRAFKYTIEAMLEEQAAEQVMEMIMEQPL